jgi:hypothetical protein
MICDKCKEDKEEVKISGYIGDRIGGHYCKKCMKTILHYFGFEIKDFPELEEQNGTRQFTELNERTTA